MATGDRNDPFRGHNFRLEIDGITLAGFTEVSGLDIDGDAVDYREGNDPVNWTRKLPALRKQTNIMLKRGITSNTELWEWHRAIAEGDPDRRDGAVILMNEAREDVGRWNFRAAWPNKITGPQLNATGTEVAVESLELCHEGLEIDFGS
ncbi:phage tail protein [Erythrobacter ani]|uniref:Phage tail protein n=1 Tax=Erythrobacter ani TaxID=2827235 RepID=A0ABS6SMN7_9SPHN|nr:phage tail protein [Erythrobacter ani]MBV7266249.1 phage tail protein [Erythrobacter ani]